MEATFTPKKLRGALAALSGALVLAGCAQVPPNAGENPADPYEAMNRHVYTFNDSIDRAVLKPVAKGYKAVTPEIVQTGVSNATDNLFSPSHAVNNVLQGKVSDGIGQGFRFLVNSTFGLLGLIDVADMIGLEEKQEDFGQTLAAWGVGQGSYLVIPFLGPSSTRDVWRYPEEFVTNPMTYALWNEDWWIGAAITAVGVIDTRAQLLEYEDLRAGVVDEYVAMRDAYLAGRERAVADGGVADPDAELERLTPLPLDDEE